MEKNVLGYLEKASMSNPDKLSFADVKFGYTYKQLLDVSRRIGSEVAKVIGNQKAVLVYMEKGAKNLAAFFGIVYGGGFYVPIDHQMPVERINLIIDTVNPGMIIYDDITKKNIDLLQGKCCKIHFDQIAESTICMETLQKIRNTMIDTDPLYVLFTSGSTGVPKGVVVSHRSVIDYGEWLCDTFQFDEGTVFGNQTPFYFSMSVLDIYATICSGATLYIIPKMFFSFPVRLLEFLQEKKVNTIYWVPSALNIVANMGALDYVEIPNLKKILFAGEVMPTKQLNVWRKHIPDALYANLFGPTEITDIGVYYVLDREFADDEPIPIGKACDNVGILILDEEGKNITEPGKTGELLIRGSFLANGYYNNFEKTKDTFIQNPLNTAYPEVVYKTGDLVYWNERNELMYASRKDFQIKHMGNRIELGEIETALSAQEGIEMCCCMYQSDSDQIIAVYTGKASSKELRKNMAQKLPRYMLPNVYYQLERMPLNMNGKIDRSLLNERYAACCGGNENAGKNN